MNEELYSRSIEIILRNQSVWGSYVASPAFPTYHYSWLRDGSFIAHAMDRVGEHESAASFFRWVGRTIERYAAKVNALEHSIRAGATIDRGMILHTRFTLEGYEGTEDTTWGDFQIDGYGTWLWALANHVTLTGNTAILEELKGAIDITIRYLALTWRLPNYDCWEEYPEYLHPHSLACVYGGLTGVGGMIHAGLLPVSSIDVEQTACEVREFLLRFGVAGGKVVKHIQPQRDGGPVRPVVHSAVDSSLLGMGFPYKVFDPADPVLAATVAEIEAELHRQGGGVYRYKADEYYGGGEWILLTAWLGSHYLLLGQKEKALDLLEWIEAQADPEGNLPEQICDHALAPAYYETWVNKWGRVASPLLWSHAMYLILYTQLREKSRE